MAQVFVITTVGLDEMLKDFQKAGKPLGTKELLPFEQAFEQAAILVAAKVHILTGDLKRSGRHDTHYDGNEWSGEIRYDADPGVFELWRGDKATKNHPEGGHNFFEPVLEVIPQLDKAVDAVFDSYFANTPV